MTTAGLTQNSTAIADGMDRRREWWISLLALALAAASLCTVRLSPFYDPDEFNYITAARNMVETHDWVTPQFNGAPRLVKPVMFYWIVAGAYEIFGVHIPVARLCSAAGAAGGVLGVWLIARHLLGRGRPAMLAALIAAGHITVVQMVRFATTDTTLWAFTTLSNYAFVRLVFPTEDEPPGRGYAYLFFIGLALALMTKGPIAFVWCGTPLLWPIARRDWAALRRFHFGQGILLALLIVSPWAALFILRNAHGLRLILLNPESHESYVQFGSPIASARGALNIFGPLLQNIVAWLPLIVIALANPREAGFKPRVRCTRFLIFWVTALLVILALAQRKSFRYMLPPVAPTALLLAGWLHAAFEKPSLRKPLRDAMIVYGIAAIVLAIPMVLVILNTHRLDARRLWVDVAIQAALAVFFLAGCRSGWVHRLAPAVMVASIYTQVGVMNWSLHPLIGTDMGIAKLAGDVTRSLAPDQKLVLYGGLSPRYLVFMSRREEVEINGMPQLLSALKWAHACLLRESDWEQVPAADREAFTEVGRCRVQRVKDARSFDISKDMEPVLLVKRTTPTTAPARP